MEASLDRSFMALALLEAEEAAKADEVPVGAVVVLDGKVVALGRNQKEASLDPTAHAEIQAIRAATVALGTWRLSGCTLLVTLEPCPMCAGALVQARVDRLVFGCRDPKAGAVVSLMNLVQDPRLNHRMEVVEGVGADEGSAVLKRFFKARRTALKAEKDKNCGELAELVEGT